MHTTRPRLLHRFFRYQMASHLRRLFDMAHTQVVRRTQRAFFPTRTVLGPRQSQHNVTINAFATMVFCLREFVRPHRRRRSRGTRQRPRGRHNILRHKCPINRRRTRHRRTGHRQPRSTRPTKNITISVFGLQNRVPRRRHPKIHQNRVGRRTDGNNSKNTGNGHQVLHRRTMRTTLQVSRHFLNGYHTTISSFVRHTVTRRQRPWRHRNGQGGRHTRRRLTGNAPAQSAHRRRTSGQQPYRPPYPRRRHPIVRPLG